MPGAALLSASWSSLPKPGERCGPASVEQIPGLASSSPLDKGRYTTHVMHFGMEWVEYGP